MHNPPLSTRNHSSIPFARTSGKMPGGRVIPTYTTYARTNIGEYEHETTGRRGSQTRGVEPHRREGGRMQVNIQANDESTYPGQKRKRYKRTLRRNTKPMSNVGPQHLQTHKCVMCGRDIRMLIMSYISRCSSAPSQQREGDLHHQLLYGNLSSCLCRQRDEIGDAAGLTPRILTMQHRLYHHRSRNRKPDRSGML